MKKLADWLVILSLFLVAFSVIAKLVNLYTLRFGCLGVKTVSCILMAIFLMQVSIWIKLSIKK